MTPPNNDEEHDPVNHPSHYTSGGIECIEAIEAALTPEEFQGFCKGNVIKYNWRSNNKGKQVQDLEKAEWYLKRLIDFLKRRVAIIKSSLTGDKQTMEKS